MRFVGPDLLGSGQLRTLRNILGRLSAGGELDAICSTLSGWDHYLTGRYDEAQQLLDRATATLPADVDPMRTMPLRINLALGKGDVATALAGAREVIAAGDVEARPSELTTATGAAFAWAGLPDEARRRSRHRTRAHPGREAGHGARHGAGRRRRRRVPQRRRRRRPARRRSARSTSPRRPDSASTTASRRRSPSGRRPGPPDATATADAEHAVVLARRATTMLGLVFVLTLAGDVLLRDGDDRGRELLDEAHADDRHVPRSRHHPAAARASDRPAPGRPITARADSRPGGATVRAGDGRAALPAVHALAPRDRTRALRVAEHREDAVQARSTASSPSPAARPPCRPPASEEDEPFRAETKSREQRFVEHEHRRRRSATPPARDRGLRATRRSATPRRASPVTTGSSGPTRSGPDRSQPVVERLPGRRRGPLLDRGTPWRAGTTRTTGERAVPPATARSRTPSTSSSRPTTASRTGSPPASRRAGAGTSTPRRPPVVAGAHRPVRRHPHPGLVDQPARLLQLVAHAAQAHHLVVDRLRPARRSDRRLSPQRTAVPRPDPCVQVPGVLLPPQLVDEPAPVGRRCAEPRRPPPPG